MIIIYIVNICIFMVLLCIACNNKLSQNDIEQKKLTFTSIPKYVMCDEQSMQLCTFFCKDIYTLFFGPVKSYKSFVII